MRIDGLDVEAGIAPYRGEYFIEGRGGETERAIGGEEAKRFDVEDLIRVFRNMARRPGASGYGRIVNTTDYAADNL